MVEPDFCVDIYGVCSDETANRGADDPLNGSWLLRIAAFGFIDCARCGGVRAFGENDVIPVLFPEVFLSTFDSEFDGRGGRRVPPIEFSRFGGARVGVICDDVIICLPSLPLGDWGTSDTGRGIPPPDFDRCRFCVGDGCCNASPDFERLNGALATDVAFGRRFGRPSSNNDDSPELHEFKPSAE